MPHSRLLPLIFIQLVLFGFLFLEQSPVSLASIGRAQLPEDNDGITDLMRAARDGERDAFKSALKWVDVNAKDDWGWTALTYAVVRGEEGMAKSLINKHADLNAVDEDGRSPLIHAIYYDRNELVKLLVKNGANLNLRDTKGVSAIGLAWSKSKDEIVELLEKAGAAKPGLEDKRADLYTQPMNKIGFRVVSSQAVIPPTSVSQLSSGAHELKMRLLVGPDGKVKKVRVLMGLPNGITAAAVNNAYRLQYQLMSSNPAEFWTPYEISVRNSRPPFPQAPLIIR